MVLEVALDLELLPEPEVVAELRPLGDVAAEAVGEHVVAAERHLGHHPGDREPFAGAVARRGVVVVAASPLRVEGDGPPPDRAPGDLLRRRLHARGDRHDRPHAVGIHHGPLEDLHPAHRAADDRVPAGDAEVIGEPGLGPHHVADGDHREPRPVRPAVDRVGRRRPGGALAATEDVRAHDEPAVGVDRPPRAHHAVPPSRRGVTPAGRAGDVAVARPRMAQQHGVGAIVGQPAEGLVRDGHVAQRGARFDGEAAVGSANVKKRRWPGSSPGCHAPVTGIGSSILSLLLPSGRWHCERPNAVARPDPRGVRPATSRLGGGGTLGVRPGCRARP